MRCGKICRPNEAHDLSMPEFRPKRGSPQSLFGAPLPNAENVSQETTCMATAKMRLLQLFRPPKTARSNRPRSFSETGQHIVDQTNVQLQNGLFVQIRPAGNDQSSHEQARLEGILASRPYHRRLPAGHRPALPGFRSCQILWSFPRISSETAGFWPVRPRRESQRPLSLWPRHCTARLFLSIPWLFIAAWILEQPNPP